MRHLLIALLLAACAATTVLAARPFAVNRTALRLSHPLRGTPTALPRGERRRARAAEPPKQFLPGPYWANSSLVGLQLECSEAAKACLVLNRIPFGDSGRCYQLGDYEPCVDRERLIVDEAALQQGHLRGVCRVDTTPSEGYVMAWDGVLQYWDDLQSKLCGRGATLSRHPFGLFECTCLGKGCPLKPTMVQQPSAAGRCALPAFWYGGLAKYTVRCNQSEEECLTKGQLFYNGGCETPTSPRPCKWREWLVLDGNAARGGTLRVKCQSHRPCGADALRLYPDGLCHDRKRLRCEKRCLGTGSLATGEDFCVDHHEIVTLEGWMEDGLCHVHIRVVYSELSFERSDDEDCPTSTSEEDES